MDDVEPDEPERAQRSRWLAWALVGAGAAAGLWLAALPIDVLVPEPPPHLARTLEPPPTAAPGADEPESGTNAEPPQPVTPLPHEREAAEPREAPPATEWVETMPLPEDETPAQAALRERLERQLAMNDLTGVQIEIAGDRIITRGALPHPADRQRVALLIRSLAPELVHEDRVEVAGER